MKVNIEKSTIKELKAEIKEIEEAITFRRNAMMTIFETAVHFQAPVRNKRLYWTVTLTKKDNPMEVLDQIEDVDVDLYVRARHMKQQGKRSDAIWDFITKES